MSDAPDQAAVAALAARGRVPEACLTGPMTELLAAARLARQQAHAPYSSFLVGAAVRGGSGRVYTGSNVESSSYGLTLCAERLAICSAVHEGETELTDIALVADTLSAPGPCGACRQFMYDFAPNAQVLMANLSDQLRQVAVGELMPWGFGPSDLAAFQARRGDDPEAGEADDS